MAHGESVEIVPAILSKTLADLREKLSRVGFAPLIQIDLMDGKFVGNKTVGVEAAELLPKEKIIEYHLMVENPLEWIKKLPGGQNSIFEVHVESVDCAGMRAVRELVKGKGSRLYAVLNPGSGVEELERCGEEFDGVLVMTVHPGKSGQSYIHEMGGKISRIREQYPDMVIEVDGGVNENTMVHAVRAGANRLAAASALFGAKEVEAEFERLKKIANEAAVD